MDKEQYLAFHQGLIDGEKTEFRDWEKNTPISKAACRSR
jgi:methylenetetrahydrofolate--tRNA-(uracil-5-)-methyltransferase